MSPLHWIIPAYFAFVFLIIFNNEYKSEIESLEIEKTRLEIVKLRLEIKGFENGAN
jgi:hypothetical protein